MQIQTDSPDKPDITALLHEHLTDMYATSPAECVHALDIIRLLRPEITFYSCRADSGLLGCAALKDLGNNRGELKSMRTAINARNQGVAVALLRHIIQAATQRCYSALLLETGTMEYFEPARQLYAKMGFSHCGPFAHYEENPNSTFMQLIL